MQLDLRTVSIRPKRQTFSHIARRLGADKPASRYQEGTLDLQVTHNFHYRPYWAPSLSYSMCGAPLSKWPIGIPLKTPASSTTRAM